jgi:hypothetical protein
MPTAARIPLPRHPRALSREVFVASWRRCGDTTPSAFFAHHQKASGQLFHGFLDPMFDEFIAKALAAELEFNFLPLGLKVRQTFPGLTLFL